MSDCQHTHVNAIPNLTTVNQSLAESMGSASATQLSRLNFEPISRDRTDQSQSQSQRQNSHPNNNNSAYSLSISDADLAHRMGMVKHPGTKEMKATTMYNNDSNEGDKDSLSILEYSLSQLASANRLVPIEITTSSNNTLNNVSNSSLEATRSFYLDWDSRQRLRKQKIDTDDMSYFDQYADTDFTNTDDVDFSSSRSDEPIGSFQMEKMYSQGLYPHHSYGDSTSGINSAETLLRENQSLSNQIANLRSLAKNDTSIATSQDNRSSFYAADMKNRGINSTAHGHHGQFLPQHLGSIQVAYGASSFGPVVGTRGTNIKDGLNEAPLQERMERAIYLKDSDQTRAHQTSTNLERKPPASGKDHGSNAHGSRSVEPAHAYQDNFSQYSHQNHSKSLFFSNNGAQGPPLNALLNFGQSELDYLSALKSTVPISSTAESTNRYRDGSSHNSGSVTSHGRLASSGSGTKYDARQMDNEARNLQDSSSAAAASQMSFPQKLHQLVTDCEMNGMEHIVSFVPNSAGFFVHDRQTFMSRLAPKYFRFTKYSSFKRQMYLYSFQVIPDGPHRGSYHNPNFIRGRPELLDNISRVSQKSRRTSSKTTPLHHRIMAYTQQRLSLVHLYESNDDQ